MDTYWRLNRCGASPLSIPMRCVEQARSEV